LKKLKMAVFWDVAQCSLVSKVLTASIIALIMEAVSTQKRRSISTRLHGAASQKTAIFIFLAVRTCNLTRKSWFLL
jgi:hypothetical protein